MKNTIVALFFLFIGPLLWGQDTDMNKTTFKFGGYIKADFINSLYHNGDVGKESPLKDIHLPGQIPVGTADENFNLDYHVKESRFNFDVKTKLKPQNHSNRPSRMLKSRFGNVGCSR